LGTPLVVGGAGVWCWCPEPYGLPADCHSAPLPSRNGASFYALNAQAQGFALLQPQQKRVFRGKTSLFLHRTDFASCWPATASGNAVVPKFRSFAKLGHGNLAKLGSTGIRYFQ